MLAEFPTSGEPIENSAKKPKTHVDKFLNGGNGTPSASPSR